jgi:hypothetical protein
LDYNTPFGGFRQSGIGRENGEYALENYIQVSSYFTLYILFRQLTFHQNRSKQSRLILIVSLELIVSNF